MKTTFHESYGEIPVSLLRLIKKHNVTPSDFNMMEMDELTHEQMESAIKNSLKRGYFCPWTYGDLWQYGNTPF